MINRRQLVQAGMLGLGALSLPGFAALLDTRGFTHGVASGEPGANSVLLWTRYAAAQDTPLRVEVAIDEQFKRVVSGGLAIAEPDRDHTARITITGLKPDSWYYYRFIALDGGSSAIGRTRTLPIGDVARFGVGVFSCSNLPFGWFNAYAHACERTDLDLMVHLGDYLYEYPVGSYPDAKLALPGRLIQPDNELLSLTDYRLRYGAYRLDADLQRLHARYPMIAQWDDHEFANDAYIDGAENHQPDTEGDWNTRREIAKRVYREWMPVSNERWAIYEIGSLATLYKVETRITARSAPLGLGEAIKGNADVSLALKTFRDGAWSDPARTLMGPQQEAWLYEGFKHSRQAGKRWQLLAQGVVMGDLRMPPEVANWIAAPAANHNAVQLAVLAGQLGLPFNYDSWGGFPAARDRLLKAALAADTNLIVLSGDSHNAWGYELNVEGRAAGVEFAGHAVTSPGYEGALANVAPADVAGALRRTNPHLAFSDTSRRGYISLQVTPQAVTGSWHFLQTIRERSTALADTQRLQVRPGQRVLRSV
jgi:alkaline phosphatase D